MANVIFSITPIGQEDVGYYGAALGTPASIVRKIAIALNKVSKSDLAQIFKPEALEQANIYPRIRHEGEEAFEYLYAYFVDLQEFY